MLAGFQATTFWVLTFTRFVCDAQVPSVIRSCMHLNIDEGQSNSYNGQNGGSCCMCPKGTYLARECNGNDPNSTVCKPCQYNGKMRTFIDYEPHIDKTCKIDRQMRDCPKSKVFVPGSRFSPSKCICPSGTISILHGFVCKPLPLPFVKNSTPSENLLPTGGTKLLVPTATNDVSQKMVDASSPHLENNGPEKELHSQDSIDDINVSTVDIPSDLNPRSSTEKYEISVSSNQTVVANLENLASSSVLMISLAGICLIGLAICLIICRRRYRGNSWSSLCRKSMTTVYLNNVTSTSKGSNDLCGESTGSPQSDADVVNEESVPLNSAAPDHGSEGAERPEIQQVCRITKREKRLRHEAFMEMAAVIHEKDLCIVGRHLLPTEGREFEDIFDKKIWERDEKARRIFSRSADLNPNLSLRHLLDSVKDLGYLKDIIEPKIEALGTDGRVNLVDSRC